MAAGQREFVVRGDGQNLIDFMYVDDAVDGFLRAAAGARRSGDGGLRVGRAGQRRRRRQAMARALGVEVTVRHEGMVPEYIEFRTVDRDDARAFGVVPSIVFDEGFKRLHGTSFARELTWRARPAWKPDRARAARIRRGGRRPRLPGHRRRRLLLRMYRAEVLARVQARSRAATILEVGCGEGMMFEGTAHRAGADGRVDDAACMRARGRAPLPAVRRRLPAAVCRSRRSPWCC